MLSKKELGEMFDLRSIPKDAKITSAKLYYGDKSIDITGQICKLILKKQKPDKYLDETEVEKILIDFHSWILSWQVDNLSKKVRLDFDTHNKEFCGFIRKICNLRPKKQKVIAEGIVRYDLRKYFVYIGHKELAEISEFLSEKLEDFKGDKVKLILEVEDENN